MDSHRSVVKQLGQIESVDPVMISVLRDGELQEFSLVVPSPAEDQAAEDTKLQKTPTSQR